MSVKDICELGALMEAEEADKVNLEAEIIRVNGEVKAHQQRYIKERNILSEKIKDYTDQEERYQNIIDEFTLYDVSNISIDNSVDYSQDNLSKQVDEIEIEFKDALNYLCGVDSNLEDKASR